jgi:type II secretory ATPase GspE/PulE/Tfp pilus assembly ATPase PilB-like protein
MNIRLVRKLCDKCKEAYTPAAELLKKLGLPAAQVTQLYRIRTPNPREKGSPLRAMQGPGLLRPHGHHRSPHRRRQREEKH